jgi:AcrR family transcriptional regulator
VPDAVPRGRHAPPIEVRLGVQRARLFAAAAEVFCRVGYAEATAGAIAAEAGMSKATFYEHFANKEECILALFDEAVTEVARATGTAAEALRAASYEFRVRAGIRALLAVVAEHPRTTQTLLVEIIGAGPAAVARRDAMLDELAAWLHRDNAKAAAREGAPAFPTQADALAVVGGSAELLARWVRTGAPEQEVLEEVTGRMLLGALR